MKEQTPPAVSDWSRLERLQYVAWVAGITLERIDGDNPNVPLLAKKPVRDLFHAILAVASWDPERLEADRAALMKAYDPAGNYDGVKVPAKWLEALKEMTE